MKRLVSIVLGGLLIFVMHMNGEEETAVFAGGCFWCSESDFDKVEGVTEVVSGYTGGHLENPSYEDVTSQGSGHYEGVKVTYDAGVISYKKLVDKFWRTVDPTDGGGQFCDRGPSYRTAVFVTDDQRGIAEQSKKEAEMVLGQKIVTEILPVGVFYEAEAYHQDYAKKNPLRYKYYRFSCSRDAKVKALWRGR